MKKALGIDIGTTGIKAVLVSEEGKVVAFEKREQHQSFPLPGRCEQDGNEILDLCIESCKALLKKTKTNPDEISCFGLDHQGESCLVWDKATAKPLYPVITWQDRRMAKASEQFEKENPGVITKITGLRSDSYYSAWKIRWILDNIPNGQERAQNGEILAGTLNTWIIWNLTGGASFVTDDSSSAVMMLCNPREGSYDPWLLNSLNIPQCLLPEIAPCNSVLGIIKSDIFGHEIPITCSLVDCSAGIFASGGATKGELTVTYGTGNFLHLITGDSFIEPLKGLTSACSFKTTTYKLYQLNGICYTAGSAIKWLRNGLGIIEDDTETQVLAESVPDTAGVFFVPALNGLATPYWDQSACGAFLGITAATKKAHFVRAVLESSALQVANCCDIMREVSKIEPTCINAMGGMTANSFLMQLQSDLSGIEVSLPTQTEPCYGSACMALSGVGAKFTNDDIKTLNPSSKRYYPRMSKSHREEKINAWLDAVQRITCWHH